uniref:Uncharacterized protein n=1 Tax=uncultured bacterium contig00060 TaxID=1181543 RepID=A0A806K0J3_9BACT|nr:hypothetical protein [uncultured bacterium contig00060]
MGTIFPTIFYGSEGTIDHQLDPPIGGTGSLAYNFYFTSNLFAGAEVGFQFFPTYAENTLFIIPLGFRGGYQFNVGKFEFPIAAVIGMVWHRYLNLGYYGLYLKGSGSVFYRAFPNWSFGINTSWYWYPQWIKDDSSKDVYGNMIDITLSARYHF